MNCQLVRGSALRRPSGFTLVELLVVIVIIGILVGLLIPVLGMARAAVQEATITTEVASLSQAMQAFKTQYQTDFPPDFSGPVSFSGQLLVDLDTNAVNDFMRRTHRYRRLDDVGVNPNTGIALQFNDLDPAEALVFWLRGFTDDQQYPLYGPPNPDGTRRPDDAVPRTPLFDFDPSRLADRDNDGFQEYYPRFGGNLPYVYLVHYNYRGAFLARPEFRAVANVSAGTAGIECPRPYLRSDKNAAPNGLAVYDVPGNYAAADKFQIIAAGLDNSFGVQLNDQTFGAFRFPDGPYPDKDHLDNVTNFAEGTLEDQLP